MHGRDERYLPGLVELARTGVEGVDGGVVAGGGHGGHVEIMCATRGTPATTELVRLGGDADIGLLRSHLSACGTATGTDWACAVLTEHPAKAAGRGGRCAELTLRLCKFGLLDIHCCYHFSHWMADQDGVDSQMGGAIGVG